MNYSRSMQWEGGENRSERGGWKRGTNKIHIARFLFKTASGKKRGKQNEEKNTKAVGLK